MLCRLKRRLDRTAIVDLKAENGKDFDFDTHIETGFQLATFQGPLCAEPVEGLAYFVESIEIDKDGIDREIGNFAPRRAQRPY
jgi:ribosome assembly protein 1